MAEAPRPGAAAPAPRIGLLGGTFDPVHNGHLRTALEVVELLGLDELRLVPVNSPALRAEPSAPPPERLAMLALAVAGEPRLRVDDRELRRGGVSYSIDTLRELRHEIGDAPCLCMVVGEDAFSGLERWKEWQRLLDYAHIVVLTRPGYTATPCAALAGWTAEHLAGDPLATLATRGRGRILRLALTQLAISSTQVRGLLRDGRSARYLLPDDVLEHIRQTGLYGAATGDNR
ncbi:MAG: nicotinate-nucleotide adenylyltransferase [Gammaproteobacteria bacterium]